MSKKLYILNLIETGIGLIKMSLMGTEEFRKNFYKQEIIRKKEEEGRRRKGKLKIKRRKNRKNKSKRK
ncbi:MAG: hypothetical protein KAQ64_04230 [Candidatus Pacebacteria bacterium]|nr:hypothetical protein [Candidatus Paceibacterota bacterium]